ncbi:tetraspanin-7-like protein [Cricetulus griseus]|nr:tetraspanin-7-like protein [Cricetulus griseus]
MTSYFFFMTFFSEKISKFSTVTYLQEEKTHSEEESDLDLKCNEAAKTKYISEYILAMSLLRRHVCFKEQGFKKEIVDTFGDGKKREGNLNSKVRHKKHYADIPSVLIVTGTMIVSFGLFGCVAACLGNPYMLKLYSLFLSLIFLVELLVSISGLLFHRGIKASFLNIYTNAVQNYNGNDDKSQAVDQVQYSLICCGVKNYTDWKTSPYFMDHGIPRSCCKDESDCNSQDLHNLTVAATKVNQRGCYGLMMSFLEANMGTIIGVLFVVTFSQVIGLRLSCCLSRFIVAHQQLIAFHLEALLP